MQVDHLEVKGRTLVSVPGYTEQVEVGVLTSFAYPLEDGSGEIVVATTRPETMLGDTAVAVHPDDDRCMHPGSCLVQPSLAVATPPQQLSRLLLFKVLQLDQVLHAVCVLLPAILHIPLSIEDMPC